MGGRSGPELGNSRTRVAVFEDAGLLDSGALALLCERMEKKNQDMLTSGTQPLDW